MRTIADYRQTGGAGLIDSDGYRLNLALPLLNARGQLFWGRRTDGQGWQVAQGGIDEGESEVQTVERELYEELGLRLEDEVRVLGCSGWHRYEVPANVLLRHRRRVSWVGQKQRWYLLQLRAAEERIAFDRTPAKPEFDDWRWVSYWHPISACVDFKRAVYRRALLELAPLAFRLDRPPDSGDGHCAG